MNACVSQFVVPVVVPALVPKEVKRVECEDLKARSLEARKNRYKCRYH